MAVSRDVMAEICRNADNLQIEIFSEHKLFGVKLSRGSRQGMRVMHSTRARIASRKLAIVFLKGFLDGAQIYSIEGNFPCGITEDFVIYVCKELRKTNVVRTF